MKKNSLLGLSLLALSSLLGCGAGEEPAPAVDCGDTGVEHLYLVHQLTIDPGDAAASAGFDLDGTTTVSGGSSIGPGCGKLDYAGIEGITGGVDNAIGPALDTVSSFIDVPAELGAALNTGGLPLVVRVAAVDSLTNDDCVEVSLLPGLPLEPPSDVGIPLSGQEAITIDPDAFDADGVPRVISEGSISGGLLEVRDLGLALPFDVPVGMNEISIDIRVDNVNLQAPITTTTLGAGQTGVIGGAVTLDTIEQLLMALGLSLDLASGFASRADLHLDASIGEACDALSAGITLGAVEAQNVGGLP